MITNSADGTIAAIRGKVEADSSTITNGTVGPKGDGSRCSAGSATAGANGLSRDANGLSPNGGDRASAVDGDGSGIAVGQVARSKGQGFGCAAKHTTTRSNGLQEQTIATKCVGGHITTEIELNGTSIEIEA